MQISPSTDLSGVVRHYLLLNLQGPSAQKLRLFSDGSIGIVFNSCCHLTMNSLPLPEAFFYGQITEYKDIECQGPGQLIVVVLQPDGLRHLADLPAGELRNKAIPVFEILGTEGLAFQRAVTTSGTSREKINLIEDFLRKRLSRQSSVADPLVALALSFVHQHKGIISIQQLTHITYSHPRQLERKFNDVIGLSPKRFCSIVRMHHFLRCLHSVPLKAGLTSCAYDSGYYDQAHLIRDFKQISGLTPSEYLKNASPLAVNFLRI